MRIQFSAGQPRNTVINAARVNASFAKRGAAGSRESQGNRARKDRLTLSPQGKLMSMIDNLTKQKQSIMDRKNSLIEDTLKNGGKVEDIKDQLKNYGRQLADIARNHFLHSRLQDSMPSRPKRPLARTIRKSQAGPIPPGRKNRLRQNI